MHARTLKPTIFDPSDPEHQAAIVRLSDHANVQVFDTIERQVADLVRTRSPHQKLTGPDLTDAIHRHLAGTPLTAYGRWVFYPWSNRLVHLLPPDEFRILRTDRNRYKIIPEEQCRLAQCRIAVIGLSVGHAAALTLAQEGVGGHFRLADYDTLDLPNLNRIRAGVHELGENKADLAARHIAEIDPYLEVSIYDQGLTNDNMTEVLTGVDLIVEECDDLYIKVAIREWAREHGVPVLMETSERGILDIERFDLEPHRPIFHGRLGDVSSDSLKGLSTKEKIPYIVALFGLDAMSIRGRASLVEIGESITTWPQLASEVSLGGSIVTDAARRILLGHLKLSGRFRVDMQQLVGGTQPEALDDAPQISAPILTAAKLPRSVQLPPKPSQRVAMEDFEYLIAHAILAPSASNLQPWRFRIEDNKLFVYVDPRYTGSFLDVDRVATHLALGAAIENICLAASGLRLVANCECVDNSEDPDLISVISFERSLAVHPCELQAQIARRCTNRRLGSGVAIPVSVLRAIVDAAEYDGVRCRLIEDRCRLDALGALLGRSNQIRFFDRVMREEFFSEIRWTAEEALSTRDGLDIATLELEPSSVAGLNVMRSHDVVEFLSQVGGGRVLQRHAREHMSGAAAAILISYPESSQAGFLACGRAMQRVWLEATKHDIAVWPNGIVLLFERLGRGGLHPKTASALKVLSGDFDSLFAIDSVEARCMLLILSIADSPTAVSLRRPMESFLLGTTPSSAKVT